MYFSASLPLRTPETRKQFFETIIQHAKLIGVLSYCFACIISCIIYLEYCETHFLASLIPICHPVEGFREKHIDPNTSLLTQLLLIGLQFWLTLVLMSSAYVYIGMACTMGLCGFSTGFELW